MKKIIACSIIFLFTTASRSQSVGINSDGSLAHASAMLDVKSTNKGLLTPRVTLTGTNDATTISSPAVSLMVYNTATAGSGATVVTPGFYYWNGTSWERLIIRTNLSSLVPICFGSVSSAGVILSGTSNFTVAGGAGQYNITITGESYTSAGYITNVTPSGGGVARAATTGEATGELVVHTWRTDTGAATATAFHFIVYKP